MQILAEVSISGITAAALGEVAGLDAIERVTMVIASLGSETVSVTGNMNSTVYTSKIKPIDLATGNLTSSADLGNGSYLFDKLAVKTLKFTKSSTSDSPVITIITKG